MIHAIMKLSVVQNGSMTWPQLQQFASGVALAYFTPDTLEPLEILARHVLPHVAG